ncbi:hypothetical protein ASG87_15355 [Frateuria sp. Soil773]|nr:hypothetical protein ASG87_15355 [Frateuria sp. Soil773]
MKTGMAAWVAFLVLLAGAASAATPGGASLPRLLPDGKPYRDADVSARGLPEAAQPGRHALRGVFPQLSPVRRLTDEGWLAAATHRESAARINFGRALRIQPNDRRLLWAYGWALLNLERPAQAMAAFRRNLALRPDRRPAWQPMAMALTYTAAGDREAALAWYRAAASSDPLRWGSDAAALRTTLYWTSRERALVRQLIDTAARADAPSRSPLAAASARASAHPQ